MKKRAWWQITILHLKLIIVANFSKKPADWVYPFLSLGLIISHLLILLTMLALNFYPLHPLMTEYIKWILYENGRCTSCLLWICSGSCSRAAVYPALLRWRLPGIPKSPRTKPSPGGGRWCTLPPEWRPARTAHSPQNDSMTRSSSSQNLKVHNMRDTEMRLKIILLKKFI